jgi:hypothetical protein
MSTAPPPSKKEHMHKLLERGSVFVHLDPRRKGVVVPDWLAGKPQLVLQIGLNFAIPIHDLVIDDDGVRCTLSFNRSPFFCVLPWSAVYALVAEDGQVTVWPSEIPTELVPAASPAVRREQPKERKEVQQRRARISVVPSPPPEPTDGARAMPTEKANEQAEESSRPTERKPNPSQRPAAPRALPALALDTAQENAEEGDGEATNEGDKPEPPTPSSPPRGPGGRTSKRPLPPYLRLVK